MVTTPVVLHVRDPAYELQCFKGHKGTQLTVQLASKHHQIVQA